MKGRFFDRYMQLLRFSLDEVEAEVPDLSGIDWQDLYEFSKKHSILGVVYRGIQKLDAQSPRPDNELELEWFARSEQIRRKNIRLNLAAARLTSGLQKAGFRSCILKGQGNALMYPDPYMRTPGDIDIWVEGRLGDILAFVKEDIPHPEVSYLHIMYPVIKGVGIEIHHRPSYLYGYFDNKRLQRYFRESSNAQFQNTVLLPEDTGSINVPTNSFNVIFQLSHLMRHFFGDGVGLRHLTDYYLLLKRGLSEGERSECLQIIKDTHMQKFASAVMYAMRTCFRIDDEYLIVSPDRRVGEFLMSEVCKTGNFGMQKSHTSGTWYIRSIAKARWLAYMMKEFPVETMALPTSKLWKRFS